MFNNKYGRPVINEGLITSYPILTDNDSSASAASILRKKFHTITDIKKFEGSPYWISDTHEHDKGDTTYKLYITKNDISEIRDIFKFCDETLGWMTIGIGVAEDDYSRVPGDSDTFFFTKRKDGRFIASEMDNVSFDAYYKFLRRRIKDLFLVIEAKFPKKTTDFTNLFHITHVQYLPKIKEQGLVPKSLGTHTERVYFSRTIEGSKQMLAKAFDGNNPPYVLGLWMSKYGDEIKQKYAFYEDPREDWAVFTYDTIDPKYIIIKLGDDWYLLNDINTDAIKAQLAYYYKNR